MTHFLARLYSWLTDGLTFDLRILLLREDFIAAPVTSIWPCVVVVKRAQIIKTTVFLKSAVCLDVVFEAQAVFFFFFVQGKKTTLFWVNCHPSHMHLWLTDTGAARFWVTIPMKGRRQEWLFLRSVSCSSLEVHVVASREVIKVVHTIFMRLVPSCHILVVSKVRVLTPYDRV